MSLKGALEWKILAAIFSVLIVLSSTMVANTGVKDLFMNSTDGFPDLLKGSPFGGLFSEPTKTTSGVKITLGVDSLDLTLGNEVNVSSDHASIENFRGDVSFDFAKNSSFFTPEGSATKIGVAFSNLVIEDARLGSLVLESADFDVTSENTNITVDDDRIEIYDFSGDISMESGRVVLDGNVTKVKNGKWTIG